MLRPVRRIRALQNRPIGRLLALENTIDVAGRGPAGIDLVEATVGGKKTRNSPNAEAKTALGLRLSQGEDRTGRFLTPTDPLYPGGCDYCASHNGRNKGYSWVRLPHQ